jgi:hypothetical protein
MTSQSPRIYTYKITFEEVPYYYYGSKKEKRFNEEYWGSPITNKWCWELYTPKKQILEFFDYSDKGYEECRKVEDRLIKPFLNDKWCLNECYGGNYSLKIKRESGIRQYENKVGIHTQTLEDKIELGRKTGIENWELKRGFFQMTTEERKELGRLTGRKVYEEGLGIFATSVEERIQFCKMNGRRLYDENLGMFSMTFEERSELGRKNYAEGKGIFSLTEEQKFERSSKGGKKSSKITNSQRWKCCETGYISTSAGVVMYQKGRGIDTSKNNRAKVS